MSPSTEKYRLLKEDEASARSSNEELTGHEYLTKNEGSSRSLVSKRVVQTCGIICAISSLLANILLSVALSKAMRPGTYHTPLADLTDSHPRAWQEHTEFSNPNETAADETWINFDIDYINVALEKSFAKEKGLPASANFPWDTNYSVYMISSVHSMHCLKSLHRSNLEYRKGLKQSYSTYHLIHCLDNIRQDLMCAADDTPRYIPVDATGTAHTGVGQFRQCRDWNKLEQWSKQNSACFSYDELIKHELDETMPFPHALRFCPKDGPGSQWLPLVQKFYDKPSDWVPEKPAPPYPDPEL